MTTYTVHEPPARRGKTAADPERFAFVRDGFYFWAFLFGPLWMLRRRLWLVLFLYLIVVALLGTGLWFVRASDTTGFAVTFLFAMLVGMEAGSLRRWTLTRRGWRNLGVVVGDDLESAERRFFAAWVDRDPVPPPVHAVSAPLSPPVPRRQAATDVIGLFPEPGAPR